jgi:hypothetical protein
VAKRCLDVVVDNSSITLQQFPTQTRMRTSTSVRSMQLASVFVVTELLLDSRDAPPRVKKRTADTRRIISIPP